MGCHRQVGSTGEGRVGDLPGQVGSTGGWETCGVGCHRQVGSTGEGRVGDLRGGVS